MKWLFGMCQDFRERRRATAGTITWNYMYGKGTSGSSIHKGKNVDLDLVSRFCR